MAKGMKTGGRQKGTPNKFTVDLKQAILEAAEAAGGSGGILGYLTLQAQENPTAYLSLLGKIIPMQIAGDAENPLRMITRIEIVPCDNRAD